MDMPQPIYLQRYIFKWLKAWFEEHLSMFGKAPFPECPLGGSAKKDEHHLNRDTEDPTTANLMTLL